MITSLYTSSSRWIAILVVFMGLHSAAEAQFIAFNDQAPGAGTSPNATTWNIRTNYGTTLPLKDISSGNAVGVTLEIRTNTVTTGGSLVVFGSTAGAPAVGTPAYNVFNGFVDFGGLGDVSVELRAQRAAVTNIFSGLDPTKKYSLKATSVRAGTLDYSNRWTVVTLLGASSFVPAHTANCITAGTDPTLTGNQVALNTGLNTTGDLADFESIVPASSTIMLVSMQYSNNTVVGPNGYRCNGSKGYAITGFRLEELGGDLNSISIVTPTNTSSFIEGQPVTITVAAGSAVSGVSFYDGPTQIGNDSTRPYSFVYSNVAVGSHSLIVVGATPSGPVLSSQVNFDVYPNQAPFISITNPVAGGSFQVGSFSMINVDASDPDDGLARVDFYVDDAFFYRETVAPYFVQYNDLPVGIHKLRAVAVDNSGLATTSAPVNIVVTNVPDTSVLIPNRATWKYLDAGVDQRSLWRPGAFNDSTWKMGQAELGFGDGVKNSVNGTPKPEQTVISGGAINARYPAIYFRRDFILPNPSLITNLIVNLLRDAGGVVYINGQEVFRSNMPDTSVVPLGGMAFTNLAVASASDDGSVYFSTNVPNPDFLVQGVNTIAVEVHQSSLTSSGLSFDLMLLAQPILPVGGTLSATGSQINPSLVNITWTGTGILQETTNMSSPANWRDVSPQPLTNSYSVNKTGALQKFFRLR
jgi:hypothetical protein